MTTPAVLADGLPGDVGRKRAAISRRGQARRGGRTRFPLWSWFWIGFAALYFLVPVFSLVQFSFGGTLANGRSAGFHWFLAVFDDPAFRSSFWLSAQIAFETVALSLLLMVPTVFWVHLRLPRLKPVMDFVSVLPFVVPPIVLVVGLEPFLQNFTWLYSRPEVLPFIYVVFALPFLYRSIDAGLRAIDLRTLSEAASNLGASTFGALARVVLPNLRSAVIGGSLLTFAIAMGEYTIASLLLFNTFPVYIFYIGQGPAAHEATALSVISLLLTWIAMAALFVIGRGGRETAQLGVTK
ncbi:MAG: ABC transporter permease subunit [Actinomycetota bacterium]|nr:ABC transporter permease subunit [Actinomycetota bacterium]